MKVGHKRMERVIKHRRRDGKVKLNRQLVDGEIMKAEVTMIGDLTNHPQIPETNIHPSANKTTNGHPKVNKIVLGQMVAGKSMIGDPTNHHQILETNIHPSINKMMNGHIKANKIVL